MADTDWNMIAAMNAGNMYGPNPYTQFQGRLPATQYHGTPTDAMGNPIQQAPGMTLNSTPAQPQPAAPQAATNLMPGAATGPGSYKYFTQGGIPSFYAANADKGSQGEWDMNPYSLARQQPQQQSQQAAQSAQPTNDTSQAYLDALSNPGKVVTPGATVPQSRSLADQPSVLDQFLANQSGGQGAGNYSNFSFFNTLNRLRGNPSNQNQGQFRHPMANALDPSLQR